jgi:hypothetical protein
VRGSRSITRVGCAASAQSNNNSSIPVAWRENTLKLTPPERIVAPKGKLTPACGGAAEVLASALDIDHFSPARRDVQQCACPNSFVAAVIDLVGARETVLHALAADIDLSQQHSHLDAAGFGRYARLQEAFADDRSG